MNFRNFVSTTLVAGFLITPFDLHAQPDQQPFIKKHGKKIGLVIGGVALAVTGGVSTFFYLRHRKKQNILAALDRGDFESFKELMQSGVPVSHTDSSGNILHAILEQSSLLREGKMEQAVALVVNDMQLKIDFNAPNENGRTPLFIAMDKLVEFERSEHYAVQLLKVIDFLITQGADKNHKRTDNHKITIRGRQTRNGSLLHTAATIMDEETKKTMFDYLLAKGVNPNLTDDNGYKYSDL